MRLGRWLPCVTASLLALIACVNAVPAQDNSTHDAVPSAINRAGAAPVGNRGSYLHVHMFGGDGLGYSDAFTNLGGFVPFEIGDGQLVFFDSQVLITSDGRAGSNIGLGLRRFSDDDPRVWGASCWYDFDNDLHVASHQLGASLETFGRFDVRLSAYGPLKSTPVVTSSSLISAVSGTGLSISRLTQNVTAMFNLEAEIGGPVPGLENILRLYVGSYYLDAKEGPRAGGAQGRFEGYLTSNMSLHALVRHDEIFDTTALVGMTYRVGQRGGNRNSSSAAGRRNERVRRNYRISKFSSSESEEIVTVRTTSGQPVPVVQVNDDPDSAVPEFALVDVNPSSPTFGQTVSPGDYDGQVSAYYFIHST